ncbi:MerR family transcriptional regulator [Streptomyces sp. NPDC058953]|uniref:MerR family transcriptional regulator n=1 Tax=unclassified Streptomyces TaxID=2593676 RepID=UPI00367680A3
MTATGTPDELTIGAFARATRLSPKALRRYDELGLLQPARVDPYTGYRYYTPAQVEAARLVAWLRRIGMPLPRIHEVCTLYAADPAAAARAVRAHWARVEAETGARRDLALFLAGELDRRAGVEPAEPAGSRTPLTIRHAAATEQGPVRTANKDAVYATPHLIAVADGYGTGGAHASTAAIRALRGLDGLHGLETAADGSAGEVLNALEDAFRRAGTAVDALDDADSGTTLTAMALAGSHLALVHIGDSRAHLLREGRLFRITHDHTLVQSMIDDGTLTEPEAASHPRRALLLKALDGPTARPDARLHEARAGDRYLLSSDGLSTVVPDDAIRTALTRAPDPESAVTALIAHALEGGAPDNVSCVVADVIPAD